MPDQGVPSPRVPVGRALRGLGALVFVASAFSARDAQAQASLDQPFADGFSLLQYEPAPSGDRFFSVPDASVFGGDMPVRAMLLGHYTLQPPLVRTDNATGQERELVSNQLFFHLDGSWAITDTWLVNLDVPFALAQSGDGPTAPEAPALADPRITVRAGLVGDDQAPFALGPALDFWIPIGSQDNLTGDGSVRAEPKLAVSGRAGAFIYAANIGYQFRKHSDTGSLEIGDTLRFGIAAGVVILNDVLQLGGELYGGGFTESDDSSNFDSSTSPLEALFGAKVRLGDFVLGAGVGPGLSDAPGVAPRAVASIAFSPSTRVTATSSTEDTQSDGDKDGIGDRTDACPDEAGPSNADPAKNGCPTGEPLPALSDEDNDGVPDAEDACPKVAGTRVDDPKKNGCPSDRDGDGILDAADACPDQAGVASQNRAKNGCIDDGDGDGVPDESDACPKQAGIRSADAKTSGCPVKIDPDKAKKEAEITFSGFVSHDDGSSTVYVELTDPVAVEVSQNKRTITYTLRGAKVVVRNNRHPLLTREFSSAVMSARLVPDKKTKSTKLVVDLREPVAPSHRMISRGKNVALEVDFPAPKTNAPKPAPPP